jgi:biotin transporter BioY
MAIGSILILIAGYCWLLVLRTPPAAAFTFGIKPFVIGDILKVVLAAAVLPSGWAILKRKASSFPH